MFVFLLLVGCFNPVQLIESSGDSIIESSIVEKQILINVEKPPEIKRLQIVSTKVDKVRLTNDKTIHFFHEQTQRD